MATLAYLPSLIVYGTAAKKTVDALLWAHTIVVGATRLANTRAAAWVGFGETQAKCDEDGFQWVSEVESHL